MQDFEPKVDHVYDISEEIVSEGLALFRKREKVTVLAIDPDPNDVQSRFVVRSRTGALMRLRASDLECPHEFEELPDGTRLCRKCDSNFTAAGKRLPSIADDCAQCGSQLSRQALECAICGTATPWAMRQKILAQEIRPAGPVRHGSAQPGDMVDGLGIAIEAVAMVFDILSNT
jgi:hypothetical protein